MLLLLLKKGQLHTFAIILFGGHHLAIGITAPFPGLSPRFQVAG